MLTEKEIKLIKNSWGKVRGIQPELIGDVFYRKLFIDIPELKRMFDSSTISQSIKLVDMLSLIVARLERLDELTEEIKQLAKRHVGYGVKDKHYEYVGAALIWTLNQALRSEWNSELEAAWVKCYTILADEMMTAAKE
ncbi:MAG: globin domain-containing protein [Bacteroidia bacterium]